MEHSIALVTGATSGLGQAAARLLAEEGWREIIVTGRSLARVQETAAQLAAEAADPSADLRGSVEYKKDLVRVLTARALRKAIERAQKGA